MTKFKASSLTDSKATLIEAHGFEIEEGTGAVLFYDVADKLVARIFNVSVVPLAAASRESSERLVELAQHYIDFDLLDWISGPQSPETAKAVSADINSLAASVLSQASGDADNDA